MTEPRIDIHLPEGRPTLAAAEDGRGESPFLNFVLPEQTVEAASTAAEAAGVSRSVWMRAVLAEALQSGAELEVSTARPKARSKNVNLRWTPAGVAALHAYAAKLGKPRSATVRTIIENALTQEVAA